MHESTPHARGSTLALSYSKKSDSVYPACAGIHPQACSMSCSSACLPRMRGDPPACEQVGWEFQVSTPHARGSTLSEKKRECTCSVYPACAGIHPARFGVLQPIARLPRMRGDPPPVGVTPVVFAVSTPHARGSTACTCTKKAQLIVYPACAGIHPAYTSIFSKIQSLPRMRGDPP